jgi:hypothetical protein
MSSRTMRSGVPLSNMTSICSLQPYSPIHQQLQELLDGIGRNCHRFTIRALGLHIGCRAWRQYPPLQHLPQETNATPALGLRSASYGSSDQNMLRQSSYLSTITHKIMRTTTLFTIHLTGISAETLRIDSSCYQHSHMYVIVAECGSCT